ncbi:MAG: CotH kinase family protein, partial [Planctomycetes bacterium]|nr:CotH kinase family protein [Planctomycetota bacterium]
MSKPVRLTGLAMIAVCVGTAAVTIFLVAVFAANLQAGAVPVVINEVLASNSHTRADPQGEYDDWIELYNQSSAPVNLGGMYLTDDPAEPIKWQFPKNLPAQTTIPAHGYLLVWADGEVGDLGLHTSFKLSAFGESVALFDRDGLTPIDSADFDAQTTDISYGRFPDGADLWSLLTSPTPGAQNIRVYQGFVEKPQFSPKHGFYEGEVLVSIACPTPGATIYYTTDSSAPFQTGTGVRSGTVATIYTAPVRIAKTTCLRAAAIKDGWYPSPVGTGTYIFVKDVITQSPTGAKPGPAWPSSGVNGQTIDYGMDPDVVNDPRYKNLMDDALLAIPSISLVTDLANLFDPQKGIYVNALNLGPTWERPVSVELIYPEPAPAQAEGADGFQIDAGLRIRGGYSRADGNPKHAFRLFFDAQYGVPRLQYPLFDEEGVSEFEAVDLRTSQNYSWSYEGGNSNSHDTFVREVFSRDTQRDMGQPYTRSRYYHLYLDGQYWGLFQTQERSEASYAASYFGGDKEDYDVIKSRGGGGEGYDVEATDGTLDAWRQLWEAAGSGFDNDGTYYRVQGLNPDGTPNPGYPKLLDIDNLIDYMLCTYYVGDPDGPVSAWALVGNNFYGIYNRVHPDGFKFFRHDAEHSLYDVQESRLLAATTIAVGSSFNQSNPLWMHTHLMVHPEYRMRFADRVYKYFFDDGVLTPKACTDRFNARVHQIEMAIIAESARWGDSKRAKPRTRDDDWLPDINRMITNYFPARTGVVLNQFKSQGWWPNVDPPTLSTRGGHTAAGFNLSMISTGTICYTLDGTDPRLPEKAGRIVDTQTLIAENAPKQVLVPTRDIGDTWKSGSAFDDSAWTAVTTGPGGIGYERGSGYQPYLSLDLGT